MYSSTCLQLGLKVVQGFAMPFMVKCNPGLLRLEGRQLIRGPSGCFLRLCLSLCKPAAGQPIDREMSVLGIEASYLTLCTQSWQCW